MNQFEAILDVEAAGHFGSAKVYDFGWLVMNNKGETVERKSFLIPEIFNNPDYMASAYYKKKLPLYDKKLSDGICALVPFEQASDEFFEMMKKYKVRNLWAYNAHYDKNALQYTSQLLLGKDFIPSDMKINYRCIMGAFMSTIGHTKKYCLAAEKTKCGNPRVNAENAYRYVSKQADFEEEHTGLADALVEAQILYKCLRQKKKMDTEPKSLFSFPSYQEIKKINKELLAG